MYRKSIESKQKKNRFSVSFQCNKQYFKNDLCPISLITSYIILMLYALKQTFSVYILNAIFHRYYRPLPLSVLDVKWFISFLMQNNLKEGGKMRGNKFQNRRYSFSSPEKNIFMKQKTSTNFFFLLNRKCFHMLLLWL